MDLSDAEGRAVVKVNYTDLTPEARVEQALSIGDNFLRTVEDRIDEAGVGEIVADVARYEAAALVEHVFTRVRGDLVDRMLTAVGTVDWGGVQAAGDGGFLKKIEDKIGVLRFSTKLTPEAQPAERLYQVREMLRNYGFNLACGVARKLLPKFPELADYVKRKDAPSVYEVTRKYRNSHQDAPEYIDGMVAIGVNIRLMQEYGDDYPLYGRFIDKINTARFEFMDWVAKEALTEQEQKLLKQILAYGRDLDFGREAVGQRPGALSGDE